MKKLLLIAFLLTFAVGTAIAQQGGNGGGNGAGGGGKGKPNHGQQGGGSYGDPIDRMTELLGLDEGQVAALELIFEDSQAVREEARENMREAADLHRTEVQTQILGVLTEDQAALWEEHRQQREALRQALDELGYGRGNGGTGGGRGTGDCNG